MWRLSLATILSVASAASCSHLPTDSHSYAATRPLHARNIVTDGSISASYDFIIAGGGLAGLVLASRLSEDANTTVLVLEAGETGDDVADTIDTPALTYYDSLTGTSYDYAYKTAAQANLGGRAIAWPRGKVLGGSSATNGLYLVRPSEPEVNAWQGLIAADDADAASAWGWDAFFQALKKSETFTPPSAGVQSTAGIQYDASVHGTDGPVHYSYPGTTFPLVGNWTPTLSALGIPPLLDSSGGANWGSFIATSALNPANYTRSYSRSAYIDPLPYRANLDILAGATVLKIVFDNSTSSHTGTTGTTSASNLTATAVQYAMSAAGKTKTVKVTKEVILAGGAVGSPQILMLSGVGPRDVLGDVGIDVLEELPGVGQHLQDHVSAGVVWKTTAETAGDVRASDSAASTSASFLSFINSATAYVNLTSLLGPAAASTFVTSVKAASAASATSIVLSKDSTVVEGYKAVYDVVAGTIMPSEVGQVELLLSITGAGVVIVQAAIQHPLSQGQITLSSDSAFDAPLIDPNYFAHAADLELMLAGIKLARKVGETAPLARYLTTETSPGSHVASDAEWEEWLKENVGTEFHPTGSCSMLPRRLGGVVDAGLKVYGLANVRVADASVYPLEFSSHLGAPTYALAEQAASIIRAYYNAEAEVVAPTSSSAPSASQATNVANPDQSSSSNGAGRDAWGLRTGMQSGLVWTALCAVVGVLASGVF